MASGRKRSRGIQVSQLTLVFGLVVIGADLRGIDHGSLWHEFAVHGVAQVRQLSGVKPLYQHRWAYGEI